MILLGKNVFFIIYDSYSKSTDAVPMLNITLFEVINHLRCTFSIHGIPYFIVSNNGPLLARKEFHPTTLLNVQFKHLKLH